MKKTLLLFIFAAVFINCNYPYNHELKADKGNNAELQAIENSGKVLYDWLFENNHGYIDVVKGKKGKCAFDTLTYFNGLRSLGVISETFIISEKERVSGCAEYISSIKYAAYKKSNAFDYFENCPELYSLYWVSGQIEPDSYSVKNVKMIDETHAMMSIYLTYGETEEPSRQILLEKEDGHWKITAVHLMPKVESTTQEKF